MHERSHHLQWIYSLDGVLRLWYHSN